MRDLTHFRCRSLLWLLKRHSIFLSMLRTPTSSRIDLNPDAFPLGFLPVWNGREVNAKQGDCPERTHENGKVRPRQHRSTARRLFSGCHGSFVSRDRFSEPPSLLEVVPPSASFYCNCVSGWSCDPNCRHSDQSSFFFYSYSQSFLADTDIIRIFVFFGIR